MNRVVDIPKLSSEPPRASFGTVKGRWKKVPRDNLSMGEQVFLDASSLAKQYWEPRLGAMARIAGGPSCAPYALAAPLALSTLGCVVRSAYFLGEHPGYWVKRFQSHFFNSTTLADDQTSLGRWDDTTAKVETIQYALEGAAYKEYDRALAAAAVIGSFLVVKSLKEKAA